MKCPYTSQRAGPNNAKRSASPGHLALMLSVSSPALIFHRCICICPSACRSHISQMPAKGGHRASFQPQWAVACTWVPLWEVRGSPRVRCAVYT